MPDHGSSGEALTKEWSSFSLTLKINVEVVYCSNALRRGAVWSFSLSPLHMIVRVLVFPTRKKPSFTEPRNSQFIKSCKKKIFANTWWKARRHLFRASVTRSVQRFWMFLKEIASWDSGGTPHHRFEKSQDYFLDCKIQSNIKKNKTVQQQGG